MNIVKKNDYLFKDISSLKGVGKKLSNYLKNKKIEKINDLLWNFPYSYTDRRELVELNKLEIGLKSIILVIDELYSSIFLPGCFVTTS